MLDKCHGAAHIMLSLLLDNDLLSLCLFPWFFLHIFLIYVEKYSFISSPEP